MIFIFGKRGCELVHREMYDAIIARNPTKLREILDAGDDPNGQDFGYPPPLAAAAGKWGCVDTVRVLIEAGADPNGEASIGFQGPIPWEQNALTSAMTHGQVDTFEVLLGAGGDPFIEICGHDTLMDWLAGSTSEAHEEMLELVRALRPDQFLAWWTGRGPRVRP